MKINGNNSAGILLEERRRQAAKSAARPERGAAYFLRAGQEGDFPRIPSGAGSFDKKEKAAFWGVEDAERPELPKPGDQTSGGAAQKTETESKIVVRPDGSRVLLITVRAAGAVVRAMSLKISGPAELAGENGRPGTEDVGAGAEERAGSGCGDPGVGGMKAESPAEMAGISGESL